MVDFKNLTGSETEPVVSEGKEARQDNRWPIGNTIGQIKNLGVIIKSSRYCFHTSVSGKRLTKWVLMVSMRKTQINNKALKETRSNLVPSRESGMRRIEPQMIKESWATQMTKRLEFRIVEIELCFLSMANSKNLSAK